MTKIRFGILSTAKIGTGQVIPAMQHGKFCEVSAIASRDPERAEKSARELNIPVSYGSYEQLLENPEVDAVYIPLPNHMHVDWAIRCIKAGKHVLCEKPVGLTSKEALKLLAVANEHPQLKVMEAFMYRHHPRWKKVAELVGSGEIGDLKAIHSFFSYDNRDPHNIRNDESMGGGGLMDIGCYSISLSRLLYGREPDNVQGIMEMDPEFNVDRLTSGMLDFSGGTSVFTCATQCFNDQHVSIYGTRGKIEMKAAFNPPTDGETSLYVSGNNRERELKFAPCNQFTIQGDLFAKAILENSQVPVPLEDAVRNMNVIDRLKAATQVSHS